MRYKPTLIDVPCLGCGHINKISRLAVSVSKAFWCDKCGCWLESPDFSLHDSANYRRSKDQEKRAAKRYGMKRQPASGSRPGAKGDLVKRGSTRAELKETIKSSYSLKLETLQKLEKETVGMETPLFELEFQGVHPFKRYIVIPEWVYTSMLHELEELRGKKCQS